MTVDNNVRWQLALKGAIDRIGAAVLLLLLLPTLALLAALVFISPGDERDRRDRRVLFRQRRVGHMGEEFVLLKFRTMHGDPAEDGEADAAWAVAAAAGASNPKGCVDRRTTIGRVLRRLRLDELPQLVNVLRGEMSLVGPRPERCNYVALFDEAIPGYHDRTRVKPGITGLSQVHGLVGTTSIRDRTDYDNVYIEQWSLWLDLRIMLLTLPAVLSDRLDTGSEYPLAVAPVAPAPALLIEDGGIRP
jgi:lipopolysaccharide/colanic/teichoic acid biosynthesis glycosyltransferase